MSYSDNLENNLKALESQQERDPNEHQKRQEQRNRVLAVAPWAEKLKESPFTQELMAQATRAAFGLRAKCYITWLQTTLRLEVREKRLELRPTPDGIAAVFLENNAEIRTQPLDLASSPEELVKQWLH
jgi:hypothetical protein